MPLSFEQRREALRKAIEVKLSGLALAYWWIVATFDDAVIVCKSENEHWKIPYTIADDGTVALGDEQRVQITYTPISESITTILGPAGVLREGEPDGSRWHAVLIEEGVTRNRTRYRREVLAKAVAKYDGVPVAWDHTGPINRSAKDVVGFVSDPKGALLESARGAGAKFAVTGILNVTDAALRGRLLESHRLGRPNLYGLSHEAFGPTKFVALPEGVVRDVEDIETIEAMAIVAHPSAGGRVERLVAGNGHESGAAEKELQMFEQMLATLKKRRPALVEAMGATPTEAQVREAYEQLLEAAPPPTPLITPTITPIPPPTSPVVSSGQLLESYFGVPASEASRFLREALVDRAFTGRTLPEPWRAEVRRQLTERPTLTLQEATSEIERWVALTARQADVVAGSGLGRTLEVRQDEADKLAEALDGLLIGRPVRHVKGTDRHGNRTISLAFDGQTMSPFRSLREGYCQITGDFELTQRPGRGYIERFSRLFEGRSDRLYESLATTDWAEVFGDSVRRAMIEDYRTITYLDDWRKLVSSVTTATDFRTMRRVRVGGYGDLPVVAQRGTYNPLTSPGDEEVTFAISKRGGTEDLAWEMIVNDDLGAVRRIPINLSRAAKRTIYHNVFDPLLNNSNIYDGVALAAAGHNNLISSALTQANTTEARKKMAKQKNFGATDELNLFPRDLWVPAEQEELAFRLTSIPVVATTGQAATETAFQRQAGPNAYHVLPYWDATDTTIAWFTADPALIDTIEIAFFMGRQEPELLVQDDPRAGSMFAADKITYKIRIIHGVVVKEFRGFVGVIW